MRHVLLDENVPHPLRPFLSEQDAQTASYAGFAGLKNGALLKAATEANLELLVTADKIIQDEQNLAPYAPKGSFSGALFLVRNRQS